MSDVNILWVRADNRLVHGQVGCQWAGKIGPNLIVVADDEAANDKAQQSLMAMTAKMSNADIRFFSLQQCADVIHKASPRQKIFLVCRNPQAARFLVEHNVPIKELNIGNQHFSEGKVVSKESHVYFDDKDLADIEAIKAKGVRVFIQIAPGDKQYDL